MALLGGKPSNDGLGGTASQFKAVLTKLCTDKGYLRAATANPKKLIEDYPGLTIQELDALRDAAVLSGADVSNVDPLHAKIYYSKPGQRGLGDGDITACCCCCCCCITGDVVRI